MNANHPYIRLDQHESEEIVAQYVKLTGREARVAIYEHSLFDFLRAGFTAADFVCVLTFLLRENKRNQYQYSLKLGNLISCHVRFMDLLGEARARDRNRIKPTPPRDEVLAAFRGVTPEGNGNCRKLSDYIHLPKT